MCQGAPLPTTDPLPWPLLTAGGVAATALLLTPLLTFLPKATLAAIIIVAVVSLLDFGVLRRTWHYSKSLEAINRRLHERGVTLHLSEVKGPVMDRLHRSDLPERMTGRMFLTQHQAIEALVPELLGRRAP